MALVSKTLPVTQPLILSGHQHFHTVFSNRAARIKSILASKPYFRSKKQDICLMLVRILLRESLRIAVPSKERTTKASLPQRITNKFLNISLSALNKCRTYTS